MGCGFGANLAGLGFRAPATPSGAEAGVLGKRDGAGTREEALADARAIVAVTDLPLADEKDFGDVDAAAEPFRLAAGVGLFGRSIEDATGDKDKPLDDAATPPSAWLRRCTRRARSPSR